MSVITVHSIKGTVNDKPIYDKLVEDGIIHEADLWSPRRKEEVHFDSVLDYQKCTDDVKALIDERCANDVPKFRKNNEGRVTEADIEEYAKHSNVQQFNMPVSRGTDGSVVWSLNYAYDDTPLTAICKLYPETRFEYYASTEGHLETSCYVKDDKLCNADGKYFDKYMYVNKNAIKKVKDSDSMQVNVWVDSKDKQSAKFYVKSDAIEAADLTGTHSWCDNKRKVFIEDKDKPITLYRTLENGERSKESWTLNDLSEAMDACKNEWRKQKAAEKANSGTTVEQQLGE